jgi:hypothetical protein
MLADPALGGNAPCEPPTPDTYHTRDEATPTTTHQPRTNDPRAADLGRRGPDLAHAVDNADRADRWRASTCTEI